MPRRMLLLALLPAALLVGCNPAPPAGDGGAPPDQAPTAPTPPAEAPLAGALPEEVVVSTNEPFWQAVVEGKEVVLRGPDVDGRRFAIATSDQADGVRTIRAADADGAIELRVREQPCQDSMSGADFPYSGELVIDGTGPARGCARPAAMPPPGEPGADAGADPADAIPARFQGRWGTDASACAEPDASIEAITIEAGALRFHESLGVPARVEQVDADTVRVTSAYSGEGEVWSSEQTLRLEGPDTLELTGPDGVRLRRVRCG